jgi:thioredoxin-related protein
MLTSLRSAAFALAGVLVLQVSALAGEGWVADFDEAVKIAKAEKKDLFVDFTGSDWCGWCKKLDAEVFSKEEFLTPMKKDFVLVSLDFPRDEAIKAKVPNPKRNDELNQKYAVRGYPTILLMTPDGTVYGQTGYQKGGPVKYVEHVTELRTKGKKELADTMAVVEAYEKAAAGDAKLAAWDKVADALQAAGDESAVAKSLVPTVRSALVFDADNAKGKKKRAVLVLLKTGNGDDEILAAGKALDPKNEAGVLEIVVQGQFMAVTDEVTAKDALKALDELDALGAQKDKEIGFMLHATGATWCADHLDDLPRAKVYAQKAKDIGTTKEGGMKKVEEILAS